MDLTEGKTYKFYIIPENGKILYIKKMKTSKVLQASCAFYQQNRSQAVPQILRNRKNANSEGGENQK